MSRGFERAVRSVSIHRSTKHQTQYISNFAIDNRFRNRPVFQQIKKRLCQIVIAIRISFTIRQTICPSPELHIQTIISSLHRIEYSTPIRYYDTIKSPFFSENIVQQILVVTTILILITIVGSHNSPSLSFLYSSFKRWKINFI